jgi:hypothetical protein
LEECEAVPLAAQATKEGTRMTIRSDTARTAFVAVCLLVILAANSDAKLDPRQESLRGVQAITVEISCSRDAIDAGLTEEKAKTVEKQIEQTGIKIMPKQLWDKVPGRCRLKITVDVCKPSGLETFIYSVRLSFVQTAALERSPQTIVDATTWELTRLAHGPKNGLAETVRENLEAMVDSFIKDCRAANPRPGERPAGAAGGDTDAPANVPSAPSGNSEPTEQKYVASTTSSVFHKPDCRWAQNIAPTNLVTYKSKDEAIKDGKKPCKSCKP